MTRLSDDRVLYVWTPRILRAALGCGAALLVLGLVLTAISSADSYVADYRALQRGQQTGQQLQLHQLAHGLAHSEGPALLVAGLLVLTLIPIGRVAFTVVVFVLERDWIFAALTSLVLVLLLLGVLLGHIG